MKTIRAVGTLAIPLAAPTLTAWSSVKIAGVNSTRMRWPNAFVTDAKPRRDTAERRVMTKSTSDTEGGRDWRPYSPEPHDIQMWVIYDSPDDHPGKIVARLWIMRAGQLWPSDQLLVGEVKDLRLRFASMGFICAPRRDADDAKIVETWL